MKLMNYHLLNIEDLVIILLCGQLECTCEILNAGIPEGHNTFFHLYSLPCTSRTVLVITPAIHFTVQYIDDMALVGYLRDDVTSYVRDENFIALKDSERLARL